MKDKILIFTQESIIKAINLIQALPLDSSYEVIIRKYKKDRSAAQNSLYWEWLTIIGKELGESKEDVHERYKSNFLVNIYERDNPDYAEMLQTLRNIYSDGMRDEALNLREKIVMLTSTTTANVQQMQEYLENIEHDAANLGIRLPFMEGL
jgi:hypothetical protein